MTALEAPPSVTHAELRIFDSGKGKKPALGARKGVISLGINPKELTWARTANWSAKQNKQPQVPEYTGPAPGTVSFEAFLARPTTTDVLGAVKKLFECVEAEKATKKDNPRPPFVQLAWGSRLVTDAAVMKSVSAKITLFDPDGTPARATVQLQLQEVPIPIPPQNPTSGGPPGRRVHVVVAGDTLQSIANAEYADPARWRDVASANRIHDPMRLRPGTRLLVPALPDAGVVVT